MGSWKLKWGKCEDLQKDAGCLELLNSDECSSLVEAATLPLPSEMNIAVPEVNEMAAPEVGALKETGDYPQVILH